MTEVYKLFLHQRRWKGSREERASWSGNKGRWSPGVSPATHACIIPHSLSASLPYTVTLSFSFSHILLSSSTYFLGGGGCHHTTWSSVWKTQSRTRTDSPCCADHSGGLDPSSSHSLSTSSLFHFAPPRLLCLSISSVSMFPPQLSRHTHSCTHNHTHVIFFLYIQYFANVKAGVENGVIYKKPFTNNAVPNSSVISYCFMFSFQGGRQSGYLVFLNNRFSGFFWKSFRFFLQCFFQFITWPFLEEGLLLFVGTTLVWSINHSATLKQLNSRDKPELCWHLTEFVK